MQKIILRWLIKCPNEFCDGPEIFAATKERPEETRCPVCGMMADIKPIYDDDFDVNTVDFGTLLLMVDAD